MNIQSYDKSGYRVFDLTDDVVFNTDLTVLTESVRNVLVDGVVHIALRFTKASYLYTESIAVLVECLEFIQEKQGSMAIISPNQDILDVLRVIGFESIIQVCNSDQELSIPA